MSPKRKLDAAETRAAVMEIANWIRDPDHSAQPTRQQIAAACRATARMLEELAPGHSVELRVPPFVAVQCVAGLEHTRGTPPNVVEVSPLIWLQLATGIIPFDHANIQASGTRAREIEAWLPIVRLA